MSQSIAEDVIELVKAAIEFGPTTSKYRTITLSCQEWGKDQVTITRKGDRHTITVEVDIRFPRAESSITRAIAAQSKWPKGLRVVSQSRKFMRLES